VSTIAVIGAGYVGLTTAACFAHLGHKVTCADVVVEKVERLSRGDIPILEAGMPELVREGIDGGRLTFVLGAAAAVAGAEFVYLCVPTPQGDDGSADLSFIEAAAAEIGPVLQPETIVINKSTVPVGSTSVVERALGRGRVPVVNGQHFRRRFDAAMGRRRSVGNDEVPRRYDIAGRDLAGACRSATERKRGRERECGREHVRRAPRPETPGSALPGRLARLPSRAAGRTEGKSRAP